MSQKMIRLENEIAPAGKMPGNSNEYMPVGGVSDMPLLGNMNQNTLGESNDTHNITGEMPPLSMNEELAGGSVNNKPADGAGEMPLLNMNEELAEGSADYKPVGGASEMPLLSMSEELAGSSKDYKPVDGAGEMPLIGINQNSSNNFPELNQAKNIDLTGTWKLQITID